MFIPPLYKAESLNFSEEKLDEELACMCGNQVKLRNCICIYTTSQQAPQPSWYAACTIPCIVKHVSEGNA